MKYLTYLVSLLFVLAFVGCNKAKEVPADQTNESAVEEVVVDTTAAVEIIE